jgi:hypothetical protein
MHLTRNDISGSINFELHGDHETMRHILAALKRSGGG